MADIVMYEADFLIDVLKKLNIPDPDIADIIQQGNPRPNNQASIAMSRSGDPLIDIARTGHPINIINIGTDDDPDFRLTIHTATGETERPIYGKVPPRNPFP